MSKYYKTRPLTGPKSNRGRPSNPDQWITGPDPKEHERYYAWLKHRAQARWREEEYELSYTDWCSIWPFELFERRGRLAEDLCCTQIQYGEGWRLGNVTIMNNREQRRLGPKQQRSESLRNKLNGR